MPPKPPRPTHMNPERVGQFRSIAEIYNGHVIVRLFGTFRTFDHDGTGGAREVEIVYFHSGDLNDAIEALEASFVEMHRLERLVVAMTTEETMKHLFPPEVIEHVKAKVAQANSEADAKADKAKGKS